MAASAGGLIVLLAVAARLTPDSRGQGTHQQLGLPPCSIRMWFGAPCPTCGMTTAWANLMRGRLVAALRANVSGTLLGLLALIGAAWLLASAIGGRCPGFVPRDDILARLALALMVIMLAEWGIRLLAGCC